MKRRAKRDRAQGRPRALPVDVAHRRSAAAGAQLPRRAPHGGNFHKFRESMSAFCRRLPRRRRLRRT
jgi:hypothetical protein